MRHLIVGMLCALSASIALAGNWSSGGGEILEHAQNPWFLDGPKTTKPVTFCVVSAPDFAVPEEALEKLVTHALTWWDGQFGNAYLPDNQVYTAGGLINLHVLINTSRFTKVPCDENTDLAFQFGYLSTFQASEFQKLQIDLTRYTALTIRTDYSNDLRGKGFIYVSPDRGPNAFHGQDVIPRAWTDNDPQFSRLQVILAHELGHVFGLQHAASNDSIMSANFAEGIVSTPSLANLDFLIYGLTGAVFFPRSGELSRDSCDQNAANAKFRAFFAIPAEMTCLRVSLTLRTLTIDVYRDQHERQTQRIGTATFADGGDRRHTQLVTLWLPSNQTMYPQIPSYYPSLLGPASSEVQHSADFVFSSDGRRVPIFVQASPRFVQIGGMLDGKLVPDLLPTGAYGRALSGWSAR